MAARSMGWCSCFPRRAQCFAPQPSVSKDITPLLTEVGDPNSCSSPSCIEAWTRAGRISYVEGTRREFQYSGCFGTEDTQEQVRQEAPGYTVEYTGPEANPSEKKRLSSCSLYWLFARLVIYASTQVFVNSVAGIMDGIASGYNGTIICAGRRGSGVIK